MGGLSPWGILQSGDAIICLHKNHTRWSSKFSMSTARYLFARLFIVKHSTVGFFVYTKTSSLLVKGFSHLKFCSVLWAYEHGGIIIVPHEFAFVVSFFFIISWKANDIEHLFQSIGIFVGIWTPPPKKNERYLTHPCILFFISPTEKKWRAYLLHHLWIETK